MNSISVLNFQLACETLIYANLLFLKRKRIIVRRWWQRHELTQRDRVGAFKKIFKYYKKHDHEKFYQFVGMSVKQFNNLHRYTKVKLEKHSYRESLDPELRLSAVLNFLVPGVSAPHQAWFYLIGRSTMYESIPEVCQCICEVLQNCIKFPVGEEFLKIAQDFYELYDFPNVIGIVDGKHISIKSPPKSGSYFRNFKNSYSINMMTVCDARGKILWVSVGDYGSKNDAGNFINSSLGIALAKEEVQFPAKTIIPNTNVECPFFLIGDGGFGLNKYLVTPFRQTKKKPLPIKSKIFNIRLQHPRKTIERLFGVICKKWRILENKLDFKLSTTDLIVYTIAHLYNYTLEEPTGTTSHNSSDDDSTSNSDSCNSEDENLCSSTSDSTLNNDSETSISTNNHKSVSSATSDERDFDSDDSVLSESTTDSSSDESNDVNLEGIENVRNYLSEYFMSPEGNVSWQWLKL